MGFTTRNLPCKLTDQELIRGDKAAKLHHEIVAAEESKKAEAKAAADRIDRQKEKLRHLAGEISSKQEYRDVQVREEKELTYQGSNRVWVMQTFRIDTDELVDTRPLTYDELQRDLKVVNMVEVDEAPVSAAAGETEPPAPGKRGRRKKEETTEDDAAR